MPEDKILDYDSFFNETYPVFKEVTRFAVLLENIGGGKVEVTSINELRSTLYHLYALLDNTEGDTQDHVLKNYIEAKEHLYRAYYDLFTMLCTLFTDNLYSYSKTYDLDVIHKVYPKYFSNITPELTVIVERISNFRSIRQTNGKMSGLGFISNNEIITVLLQWFKEMQSLTNVFIEMQTGINDSKKKEKQKNRLDLVLKILIPLIALILGFLLNHFFGNK